MLRRFSANFAVFSMFIDMFMSVIALLTATVSRHLFNSLPWVSDILVPIWTPLELYMIFALILVAVLLLFSVYDGRRNLRVVDEFSSVTMGTLLAAVAMAGILYFSYRDISRFLFAFFIFLTWVLLLLWRAVYRLAFRMRFSRVAQERRVLILGAGVIGQKVQAAVGEQAGLGMKFCGYLDDDPGKQDRMPDVMGTLDRAREVVFAQKVDDVVIALPMSAHKRLNQVVAELHDLPVRVWVIPDYFSMTLHRATVEEFSGIPMLDLRAPALDEYQRMVKRVFDLTVTLFSMPFALPLMGVVALLIKLDSPGPVLYRAKRVGENGKIFTMYKFRTMYINADQMGHLVEKVDAQGNVVYKSPEDPRVTKIGKTLRRKSLDELPQLFNVLRGNMSLVGPRPEMPNLVEKYEPWQRKRFAVPQGMTGWWQVNGRSDKPMHLNTQDDLYYVQHYSMWLDLQILFKTAWTVVRGKGAY